MITEIVTHGSPAHLDELVGALLLMRYGEEKLPGVSTAKLRCLTAEDNVEELSRRTDVVLLGVGAGTFDEHVFNGDKSKKDECCATLIAKFLGVDQEFRWRKILRYVLHTDKNKPELTLDLATTVMRFQLQGLGLHAVLQYTETTVDAALAETDQFADVSLHKIKEEELWIRGERHWIAVVEDDNPKISSAARFFGAVVVVVKNSSGHVQILTANHLRLDMLDILRVLRSRERWMKNNGSVIEWRKLEAEGAIEEAPEWFFHKEANNILNGGRSRPDISPTKLPLPMIVEAVKVGLEAHRFEPARQEKCQSGICTATLRTPCPWYNLGLFRCRAIRANMNRVSR